MTPALFLATIIIAMFAYPAARALDRWVQRIEMGVFARRRREMHDQAVATQAVKAMTADAWQSAHDTARPTARAPV